MSAGDRAGWFDRRLRRLYPGSFALVMATGIVSNAFLFLGRRELSGALLVVNLVAYPVLVVLTLVRAARYPRELWADLVNPRLVFSFFTVVAATDILGAQLHLRGYDRIAIGLWLAALVLWVLLGYFSFAVVTFDDGRSGADVIHGVG